MSERQKFVFCEGPDDLAVLQGVAKSIDLGHLFIEAFDGKDKLRAFLSQIKARPEFAQNRVETLAVVRDADASLPSAFQSVCDALTANGFHPPTNNGEVLGSDFKVGVYVIGPKNDTGEVEDLCLLSVSDRPEFACLEEYFWCVAEKSERKNFTAKARLRAWMATHQDYDYKVGLAARHGYWPWHHAVFDPLKEFLRKL